MEVKLPPSSPPPYRLRRFKASDLDSVMAINRACLPENYSGAFFLDLHKDAPHSFMVAEHEGRVVGYIMCRVEFGFSELQRFKVSRKGHIISVAVLPEHRNRGVGLALLTAALKALQSHYNCSEAYLEVRVSNREAINLYRKLGFKPMKTVQGYYLNGEAASVMGRRLPLEKEEEERFPKEIIISPEENQP
ncbi:N-acetyltransferase [Candidatus Hecatella orcuttiae]|jgi:ribosomal-protein-alanine N-acetyltransferase|uniref:N-acetyltransferase n=1 Tax=Candidatus Hecatella orcuttiae TaxID=1935119 RepID=UPI002867DFB9|nr:N-acetyltransferase [Candidatus Hecatella orcuttiae]